MRPSLLTVPERPLKRGRIFRFAGLVLALMFTARSSYFGLPAAEAGDPVLTNGNEVAVALSSLTELDKFKAAPFVAGYPESARTFYSPVDQVHDALKELVSSATKSVVVSMYGYDDDELDAVIREKLESDRIFVQMSLDKSQSAGAHEKEILRKWNNDGIGNSIAIGHSEHDAIMHLKMIIIDGLDVVTGSTNWSKSGEFDQDNQLTVLRDALVAAEARTRLDIIHDDMLQQMASSSAGTVHRRRTAHQ
jgi:hypothetical protein